MFTFLLPLIAAGCGDDCGPWDALPVDDPDGLLPAEDLDGVRGAIDTFAEWTGRPETCVSEVRIVEEIELDGFTWAGIYDQRSRRVEVVADYALTSATPHELCHALDHEEGWVSRQNADVLADWAAGVDAERYPAEDESTEEAFAQICEEGPVLPALYDALTESCGVEVGDPAVAWVDEVAFAPREDVTFDAFSAEATWAAIGGSERTGVLMDVVLADGGAGPLVLDVALDGTESRDDYVLSPILHRLDDAGIAETLALAPYTVRSLGGSPSMQLHALLGSTGDPLLVSLLDGSAWRVRSAPLALEAVAFPAFYPETLLEGFEHEGRAFVLGTLDGADVLALVDLDAGTVAPIVDDEAELFRADQPVALYADAEGAIALFGYGASVLVGFDWDGGVRWRQAIPGGEDRIRGLTRLPDGTVYVAPNVYVPVGDNVRAGVPLPMRLDPATGAWSVPDGGCDEAWAYYGWTLSGDAPATLSWEESGEDGYRLLRGTLTVEPAG